MSSQIIPLKGRADSRNPAEFWPQRLFPLELRHRGDAARAARHKVDCWLVNSGWTGGIYGVGRRMPIKATRALVTGALDGSLKGVSFRTDPYFGFAVPTSVPGVEPHLLYPMKTWKDKAAFDETARKLVRMFQENF